MVRRPESVFFRRGYAHGQQARDKMLNMLIIREMQVKTTMRHHLTSVRMAIIRRTQISVRDDVEKREPS